MFEKLSTFGNNIRNKWNSIPQEKKSAFAEKMLDYSNGLSKQQPQSDMAQIDFTPQDYSWVFQPTRRSMFYGN